MLKTALTDKNTQCLKQLLQITRTALKIETQCSKPHLQLKNTVCILMERSKTVLMES